MMGNPIVYSNQSPKELLGVAPVGTRCRVKSMSTVDRETLNRSSIAEQPCQ